MTIPCLCLVYVMSFVECKVFTLLSLPAQKYIFFTVDVQSAPRKLMEYQGPAIAMSP